MRIARSRSRHTNARTIAWSRGCPDRAMVFRPTVYKEPRGKSRTIAVQQVKHGILSKEEIDHHEDTSEGIGAINRFPAA